MIKFFTVEQVIEIHDVFLEDHGGLPGIRDKGLLISAVEMPRAFVFGEYLHKTLYDMASAYLFHIVQNHPFCDGNKRTGALATILFLEENGVKITFMEKKENKMNKDICHQSAATLIKNIKDKKISAVEVMQAHLDYIEKINPILNGLVQKFSREDLLKKASRADQELEKGNSLGKLHGLPVTIKDKHLVKGLVSCMGSTGLKDKVAQEDSTIVSRLKNEGAIILGITNVPEFLSCYETDNTVYGRTKNPYDLQKTPGGSSGGCSALVAAGCTPLSIGSDAVGSIRWPAHCTGIAAHKPTIGLVPSTGSPMGNARGLMSQFATSGPMARSVEDLALILPIISGPDGVDPHIPPVSLRGFNELDVENLRIAYFLEDGLSHPSNDVAETLEMVVAELKKQFKIVDLIKPDCLKKSYHLIWEGFYLGSDGAESVRKNLESLNVKTPSPLMQQFILEAKKSHSSVTQFRNLFKEIDQFRIQMLESLKDYDLLISPVAATVAKEHGKTLKESKDMSPCMVHSISGWPVTVVRCGASSAGLPIGLQIAAKPWNDYLTLAFGKKLEKMFGGWQPPYINMPQSDFQAMSGHHLGSSFGRLCS